MLKTLALALALAGVSALAVAEPSEARSSKSKAKNSQAQQLQRRTATVTRRSPASVQTPSLRDRQAMFQPNGRLDGEAFFSSVAERAGDIGN